MNTVLFACVHTAGRSQMAAAWFNLLSDPTKARAISAGTEPGPRVHPEVVVAMSEVGLDLSGASTSKLTTAMAQRAHMLITMGVRRRVSGRSACDPRRLAARGPKGKPIQTVRAIRDEIRVAYRSWSTRRAGCAEHASLPRKNHWSLNGAPLDGGPGATGQGRKGRYPEASGSRVPVRAQRLSAPPGDSRRTCSDCLRKRRR